MSPIHVTCPRCKAKPGEKCRNYLGKNCAPHRERTQANATPDDLKAEAEAEAAKFLTPKPKTCQPTLF